MRITTETVFERLTDALMILQRTKEDLSRDSYAPGRLDLLQEVKVSQESVQLAIDECRNQIGREYTPPPRVEGKSS